MRGMTLLARSVPLQEMVVVLVVAGLATAAVGVPRRVLDQAGSQSLAGMLETTRLPVDAVIVQLPLSTRTDPRFGGAHVTSLAEAGEAVTQAADQPLEEVAPYLAEAAFVFDTVRFAVQQVNGETAPLPTFIRLRFAPDVEPRIRNLEGRRASTRPETSEGLPLIEVALSEDSLRASRLAVGDVLEVGRDPLDRNATFIPSGLGAVALRIVEAVALPDPDDAVWAGDPTPASGLVVDTSNGADVFLTALLRADQFQLTSEIPATAGLVGVGVFPLEVGAIDRETSVIVEEAVRKLDATTGDIPSSRGEPGFRSGIPFLLEVERNRREATERVVDLLVVGLLGLAAIVSFSLARVSTDRRRVRVALNRGRGASAPATVLATLVVVAPLSLLGAVLSSWVMARRWTPYRSGGEVLVIAGVVGAAYLAASLKTVAAPLPVLLGKAPAGWRRVRTAVAVGLPLAAVAAVLSGRQGGSAGLVAPYLVAIASAVIAERVLRRSMRLPGSIAAIGGWMAARRQAAFGYLTPVAVGMTVAIVAGGLMASIGRSLEAASWAEVSAPVRVDLPAGLTVDQVDDLPGVAISTASVRVETRLVSEQGRLVVVDAGDLRTLLSQIPTSLSIPDVMLDPRRVDPIPVLFSRRFGARPVELGDTFTGILGGEGRSLEVVGFVDSFPGASSTAPILVMDRDHYRALAEQVPPVRQVLLAESSESLLAHVSRLGGTVTIREDVEDRLREAPLVAGVIAMTTWAAVVAAGFGLAGLVAGLMVEVGELRMVGAILEAVGLGSGTRRRLAFVTMAPSTVGAVVGGVIGWWITARWLGSVVDFGPFAGQGVGLQFDFGAAGRLGLLGLAVVSAVGWLGLVVFQRGSAARVLREGEAT
jgi:hypothetical protein